MISAKSALALATELSHLSLIFWASSVCATATASSAATTTYFSSAFFLSTEMIANISSVSILAFSN